MFKVCPKRCRHNAASYRQSALALPLVGQAPVTIARRSLRVFGRSRQSFATSVAAANPVTVKTYSAALHTAPGEHGSAVRLEGGMA